MRRTWTTVFLLIQVALRGQSQSMAEGPEDASTLLALGSSRFESGNLSEAKALFERVVASRERLDRPSDPVLADALNHLAFVYRLQDRPSEAETLYRRALAIFRNTSRTDQTAAVTNNLGIVVLRLGRWKEARSLFLEAIALWRKQPGPDSPEFASGLTNLAVLYQSRHDFGKAEPLLKRAMEIDRSVFLPDHPRIALDLSNWATFLAARKHYPEAESALLRSLQMFEKSIPENHFDLGHTALNLAAVYKLEHKYEDSERLYRRGIDVLERAWGPDDRRLVPYFEHLAEVLRARSEFAEAAAVDVQAARIRL
jgi:tetratricopeptide (TPR) repeat protein